MNADKNLRVVTAAAGHLMAIAAIENECFSRPWSQAALQEAIVDPRTVFLVALLDQTVVGYAHFSFVLDEGYVAKVAVHDSSRRRGVGAALLEAMCVRAIDKGLSFLSLEVRVSNMTAIRLYERHGFILCGRRNRFYDDPPEDGLIMTRMFSPPSV